MPSPGILTGSNEASRLFRTTSGDGDAFSQQGVFGVNPGATPKFAYNNGRRDAEYRDTMARLFIELPPDSVATFLNTIPENTRNLARVLTTGGPTAGGGGTGFVDFLLTSATETFQEKAQIVDTLTDHYVAFYSGQSPPLFGYTGTVLNTYQDDQRVWLMQLYRTVLRGTRLANRGIYANLRYDSYLVSGYLEQMQMSISGDTDNSAGTFNFTMRVQRMTVITPSLTQATTLESNAAEVSSIFGEVGLGLRSADTERIETTTPDEPPTATEGPAASPTSAVSDPATRDVLLSSGLTDTEVTEVLESSAEEVMSRGDRSGPAEDPRESAYSSEADAPVSRAYTLAVVDVGRTDATSSEERLFTSRYDTPDPTPADLARRYGVDTSYVVPRTNSAGEVTGYTVYGSTPNPDNMSSDGLGGLTNILGDVPETSSELSSREGARPRSGPRSRGESSLMSTA